jgi:hypothetical protein
VAQAGQPGETPEFSPRGVPGSVWLIA